MELYSKVPCIARTRKFVKHFIATGKLCDEAACYDSFTPFMWGMISGEEYDGSVAKLLTPEHSLSEMPVTTVERSSPMYRFDNAVVGPAFASKSAPDFYGCCWNGAVWPYANTQVIEGVGEVANRNGKYHDSFIRMFEGYTALHFYCGDRSATDIVEHYRPTDGFPFSQTHDCFHSCCIDILMTYLAGIKLSDTGKVSFKTLCRDEFSISGVVIDGKEYSFRQYRCDGRLCREVRVSD